MSIIDNAKALVGPLVFKKDGSVSCGFGSTTRASVIMDRENWGKLADGIKTVEAELASLRAVNAVLVEALNRIANTCENFDGCPVGPQTIAEIAKAALSHAEQAKQVQDLSRLR